jgi:hypothetical protein
MISKRKMSIQNSDIYDYELDMSESIISEGVLINTPFIHNFSVKKPKEYNLKYRLYTEEANSDGELNYENEEIIDQIEGDLEAYDKNAQKKQRILGKKRSKSLLVLKNAYRLNETTKYYNTYKIKQK